MVSSTPVFLVLFLVGCVTTLTLQDGYIALNTPKKTFSSGSNLLIRQSSRYCPLCDSSVYSYCSDKLLHDACCCLGPYQPPGSLPRECAYADCSFLHANTCQEHSLITACCCSSRFQVFK